MSATLAIDPDTARWLAEIDPALALLPRALPVADLGWYLDDARWMPGSGCRLAFRAAMPDGSSRFVAVHVSTDGWMHHDERADPRLRGIAVLADPAAVLSRLRSGLGSVALACRTEPVRYRPHSRAVWRVDLEVSDGTIRLFAKAFTPETFDHVAGVARALSEASDGGEPVPRMASVWPDVHVILADAVSGRAASAVLGDAAIGRRQRSAIGRRLGALLADFHALQGGAGPRFAAADQLAAIEASLPAVERVEPRFAARLRSISDVLAAGLPSTGPEVLAHGAFRSGQVIVGPDGRMSILDTDGVGRSHPARDAGNALAHLAWQAIRDPGVAPQLAASGQDFLAGYASQAGRIDPSVVAWWHAAALLQIAARRYRRLEVASWSLTPALADAAEDLVGARPRRSVTVPANALDAARMTPHLRSVLAPVAADPETLEVLEAEAIGRAVGRRLVVRYLVRGLDRDGDTTVIGKVLADDERARVLHETLSRLSEGPFSRPPMRVPEPLGLVPRHAMVLYRACDGVPLDRLTTGPEAEAGVRRAARWLARMHGSATLSRRFSIDREELSTADWADRIGDHHPALAAAAHRLADGWAATARSAAVEGDASIHKDFHAGHVLIGREIWVIDLDEARRGDPAFDLAHFCTYLELNGAPATSGMSLGYAFLEEYRTATGWQDQGTYGPFRAYTWLKIAKQWLLGSGPARDASPAVRAHGIARALAKGNECLAA